MINLEKAHYINYLSLLGVFRIELDFERRNLEFHYKIRFFLTIKKEIMKR